MEGNLIGTDSLGTSKVANGRGIYVHGFAQHNIVGGTVAGSGNTISGNTGDGILLANDSLHTKVIGNRIGYACMPGRVVSRILRSLG